MEDLKEKQKSIYEALSYSQKRSDLLIISICGAGIFTTLESIKFLSENSRDTNYVIIKIAGILFLIGIISNFLSQLSAQLSHKNDYLLHQIFIDLEMPMRNLKGSVKKEAKKYDKKSEKFSDVTYRLNVLSMISMFIALAFLIIFFSFIF